MTVFSSAGREANGKIFRLGRGLLRVGFAEVVLGFWTKYVRRRQAPDSEYG